MSEQVLGKELQVLQDNGYLLHFEINTHTERGLLGRPCILYPNGAKLYGLPVIEKTELDIIETNKLIRQAYDELQENLAQLVKLKTLEAELSALGRMVVDCVNSGYYDDLYDFADTYEGNSNE